MSQPSAETPIPTPPRKPGLLLLGGTTLLVIFNMLLGFASGWRDAGDVSAALGAAVAQLVFPVIIALLFSISPRFRNPVSRTKVVFWTSVLVFLSTLSQLVRPA